MSDQEQDLNARDGGRSRRYGRSRNQELDLSEVKYYNVDLLRRYMTEEGKIRPRRQTKVSAKAQRRLAKAIKRARALALLPYTSEHVHDNS